MTQKDYYKIMGLEKSATPAEIKRAYRKLARKYHPDVSKEADAEPKFKELGEAYEVLKNPEKRQQYDQFGHDKQYQQSSTSRPHQDTWNEDSIRQQQNQHYNFDVDDILSSMFGQNSAHTRHDFYGKGQDIHSKLTINLEESFLGGEKLIQLQIPEMDATGQLTQKVKHIKVKIPKGIKDKQQIRLKGQGGLTSQHNRGDLYIEVSIAPHKLFSLDNNDVYLELPVTPWEAALGTSVEVPTLAGSIKMKLPANSTSGTKLRLKGKGLANSKITGEQYVVLKVVVPAVDDPAVQALYEELSTKVKYNPRANLEV